jgi:hypothetical protein
MVVVHHVHYPRLLVFCRSVVVPTVALPTSLAFPINAAGHSDALLLIPRLYAYYISHTFVVVILCLFRAGSTS